MNFERRIVGKQTKPISFCFSLATRASLLALLQLLGPAHSVAAQPDIPTGSLIWQIGIPDDLPTEFSDYHRGPEVVNIPTVGTVLDGLGCAQISCGVRAVNNPTLDIKYPLTQVPADGAFFSFKLIRAPLSGSQMAVFSNGAFAGLIQLWGTEGSPYPYPWRKTYRLYIPKEFLHVGTNELRFMAPRPMWSNATADSQQWWRWDYLKLEALDKPVSEPWHGKISYLGTTMTMGANGFWLDDETLAMTPIVLKWLGIAYSGNTMRANFWIDVTHQQPKRLEYLQLLAQYNMTVLADYISGNHFQNDASGQMPQKMKDSLKDFFQTEGKYFQYYELGNEPCMCGSPGGGIAEYLRLAESVNALKPSYVKTVAPGWAYGGNLNVTPLNWDAYVDERRKVESLCDCINGHSYGYSYTSARGGSFIEELEGAGQVEDGWPKEYLVSETGSNHSHDDTNGGARQASTEPHIQAFDRILRAHLAVVDRTMQHAAIFSDFGLFQHPASFQDLTQFQAMDSPEGPGKDTRVKTYRRLALAYATHGAPLPYTVVNSADLSYKMVYFRAVDTSTLAPQLGSGATSNKILLSFINFENVPETLDVRVTLPQAATYQAERIGAGDKWGAVDSLLTVAGTPDVELKEALGPGESVEYILTPPPVSKK